MKTLDLWITADGEIDYEDGYIAPSVTARGKCKSRMVSPREFSLWSVTAELDAGTELEWNENHGDEAVYVKKGSLTYDGRVCPVDGALILEAGVPAVVKVTEPTGVPAAGFTAFTVAVMIPSPKIASRSVELMVVVVPTGLTV